MFLDVDTVTGAGNVMQARYHDIGALRCVLGPCDLAIRAHPHTPAARSCEKKKALS